MRRIGCAAWIGAAIVGTLALCTGPGPAWSGQPAPGSVVVAPGNSVIVRGPAKVIVRSGAPSAPDPRGQVPLGNNLPNFGPSYPFGYNYKGPSYPFGNRYYGPPSQVAPVYVHPGHGAKRWVPGYWGQQWVPQYYVYEVWVPGYYADMGWVEGRYEEQATESGGYYQQVWVDGYWAQ